MLSLFAKRFALVASCAVSSLWLAPVHAQESVAALAAQKQQHQQAIRGFEQELESVRQKVDESEKLLKVLREDLSSRQVQLAGLKRELGENPGPTDERVLANESRRVTMAELAVKAREATLERLESKESELQQQINDAQNAIARAESRMQSAARAAEDAKRQAAADAAARALAEQQRQEAQAAEQALAEQRRAEEEAARLAAEQERLANEKAEAERAAAASAAAAAEASAQVNNRGAAASSRPPQSMSKAERLRARSNAQPDMSQVVLEGEEPIFTGDDGGRVIMRSRNIPEPLVMLEVAPGEYSADVEVTPGKAYFDIGARRYRGVFNDQAGNNRYRFHYDRSNPEKPTLRIFKL